MMFRIIFLFGLLGLFSCASVPEVPDYKNVGTPNLEVTLETSGGFLKSKNATLFFYEYIGHCKYTVLGKLEIDRSVKINVPTGNILEVAVSFESNFILGRDKNTKLRSQFFRAQKNKSYLLEIMERNGSFGTFFYENQKGSNLELENEMPESCERFDEVKG
jgi:hypothetical protein